MAYLTSPAGESRIAARIRRLAQDRLEAYGRLRIGIGCAPGLGNARIASSQIIPRSRDTHLKKGWREENGHRKFGERTATS